MEIEALYRRPRTTKPEAGHRIYPYLLRGMTITRTNRVWAMDITYICEKQNHQFSVAAPALRDSGILLAHGLFAKASRAAWPASASVAR